MTNTESRRRGRVLLYTLLSGLLVTTGCFDDGPDARISGPDGLGMLVVDGSLFTDLAIIGEPPDEPTFGHQYQMVWALGPGQAVVSRGDDWMYRLGTTSSSATFLDGLQDLDVVASQIQVGAWSATPTDFWGAHENGKFFRFDGSWNLYDSGLGPTYDFAALWGFASNDIWAVGSNRSAGGGTNAAVAAHWDGSGWTGVPLPGGVFLRGIWGATPNDVWAVGYASTLLHWNGTSWTDESASLPLGVDLENIHGTAPDDVWASGSYEGAFGGVMLHYDGMTWSLDASFDANFSLDAGHVYSVQAQADDVVFAAGDGLFLYNGTSWSKVEHPALELTPGDDLNFWDMHIGFGRLYAITPGNTNLGIPGRLITGDVAGSEIVNITVQGSVAPDVSVTLTNVATGEYYVECTDLAGIASFVVPTGKYLTHARNFNICNAADLAIWPNPPGFFEAPSPNRLPGRGSSILLSGTSVPLTPANYESAFLAPISFPGGSTSLTLDLQPTGAIVDCTLLDEFGNPFTVPANAFVYSVLPFDDDADLPPLPPGAPQGAENLPRGIGTAVAVLQAGQLSTCSTDGLPAGDYVLETPPIEVADETKVFREAVTITETQAAGGETVVLTFDPEPVRAFTGYLYDVLGDNQGPTDLGQLITYGWGGTPGSPTNEFIVTTDFHRVGETGPADFTLQLLLDGATLNLRTTCEPAAGGAYTCAVSGGGATTVTVEGSAERIDGSTNGSVTWKVDVGDLETVHFRIFSRSGNSPQPRDSAPDSGLQKANKDGTLNSFVIMSE